MLLSYIKYSLITLRLLSFSIIKLHQITLNAPSLLAEDLFRCSIRKDEEKRRKSERKAECGGVSPSSAVGGRDEVLADGHRARRPEDGAEEVGGRLAHFRAAGLLGGAVGGQEEAAVSPAVLRGGTRCP